MGFTPFALSIHHYINSVGADCGFAALVGLAILVLLYFAQARESTSLRNRVAESEQRVQQLEARIAQVGRSGGAPVPAPAPKLVPSPGDQQGAPSAAPGAATGATSAPATAAGATSAPATAAGATSAPATAADATGVRRQAVAAGATGAGARAATAGATGAGRHSAAAHSPPPMPVKHPEPAAPAGVGAPALAAATRLIPTSLGAPGGAPTPPATAAGALAADTPIEDTAFVSPAAARAAMGSNGLAAATAGNHGGAPAAPPPRLSTRPTAGAVPPGLRGPGGAGLGGPSGRSDRLRKGLIALVSGLLVAGLVAVLVIVTSGNGSSSSSTSHAPATTTAASRHKAPVVAFNPRSVKLAVLNGTATAGLAARIATKLEGRGYSVGTTTNAVTQTNTTSVVAYTPGQRRAAVAVAQSLGLSAATVQPIDTSTQDIACPPPSPCANTVVVTAGADLASST